MIARALLSIALVVCIGGEALALDALEDRVRRSLESEVRWDNVEGKPMWTAGVKPKYDFAKGMHLVTLPPGESVTVRLPAYEVLRVIRADGTLDAGDLDIGFSMGSGLIGYVTPISDKANFSLFADPQRPYEMLAHISRPRDAAGPISIGVFVSRHLAHRDQVSYRDIIDLGKAGRVQLDVEGSVDRNPYWILSNEERKSITLRGPGRFKVDTRHRFLAGDRGLLRDYFLKITEGEDKYVASLEYSTSQESSEVIYVDGEAQVLSRLESAFLVLDEKRDYDLEFKSSAPVFVRISKSEERPYFFKGSDSFSRFDLIGKPFQRSPWDLTEDQISAVLADPTGSDLELVDLVAMRLARDNSRSGGGNIASALLAHVATSRADYPELRKRLGEVSGFHTYFRDLVPGSEVAENLQLRYFSVRKLQRTGDFRHWLALGEGQIDAAMNRLSSATFCPLDGDENRRVYHLPERSTPTLLRLVAVTEDLQGEAELQMKLSDTDVRKFTVSSSSALPWLETRTTLGEAGLQWMEGGTLDSGFGSRRNPAPMSEVGVFEFVVPAEVESIEIFGTKGLPIAVQVKASGDSKLTCDEFLAVVGSMKDGEAVSDYLLSCVHEEALDPNASRSKHELFNYWLPLRRYVQSRVRLFSESVPTNTLPEGRDWFAELDRLIDYGEHFLATRLARTLYLQAQNATDRSLAFDRLNLLAGRELGEDTSIMNACVALVHDSDLASIENLAKLLRQKGETDLALMLAQSLPSGVKSTRDLRLATAYVAGWWTRFEHILTESKTDPVCSLWRGHWFWRKGDKVGAREQWAAAGEIGKPWIVHADMTRQALGLIRDDSDDGLQKWAESEARAPGLHHWRPVSSDSVRAFDAGVSVKAVERGSSMTAYIASPDQPLELDFASPQRVRVECRPLHRSNSTKPIEGWVTVDVAGAERKIPVVNNFRTSSLQIVGRESQSPGGAVTDEFAVTGWNSRVSVVADFGPVMVRVFTMAPEVRSGELPPLNLHTAAWAYLERNQTDLAFDGKSPFGAVKVVTAEGDVEEVQIQSPFTSISDEDVQLVERKMTGLLRVAQHTLHQSERSVLTMMRDLLWLKESGSGVNVDAVVAEASELASEHSEFPEVATLYSKLTRDRYWDPVLSVDQSAGVRELVETGWQPESQKYQNRMRLLPELGAKEQLVAAGAGTTAVLTNREDNRVTVDLSLVSPSFIAPIPLKASLAINGGPATHFTLTAEQPNETFFFPAPVGRTEVSVVVHEAASNHYLNLKIDAEQEGELYERNTSRDYFVATDDEPVMLRVAGPAWVRVSRKQQSESRFEYVHIKDDVQALTLSPLPDEDEALFRVHVMRQDPNSDYRHPPYVERSVVPVAAPLEVVQSLHGRPDSVTYDDRFDLGGQEDGTWTLGAGLHSRRPVEEDSSGGESPENFLQADLTYRFFDSERKLYHRASILARAREHGSETFGAEYGLQYRPSGHLFNYTLTGKGYVQGGEWSVGALGSVSMSQELSPKLSHSPLASVFFRELSLSDFGDRPEEVDQDIFTPFKADHLYGLRLGDKLHYRPWRNTRFTAGGGLMTNEDFNPFSPDSVRYSLGVEQIINSYRIAAELRGLHFFEDDDRSESYWRHRFNLGVTGEYWLANRNRVEVGLDWTHFLDQGDNSLYLIGRWHFGNGRGLRDFRPGERSFVEARERRAQRLRNSRTED